MNFFNLNGMRAEPEKCHALMITILVAFVTVQAYIIIAARRRKKTA